MSVATENLKAAKDAALKFSTRANHWKFTDREIRIVIKTLQEELQKRKQARRQANEDSP